MAKGNSLMSCEICNKKSNYNGCVCLVNFEFFLCKKHYLGFCKEWKSYKRRIKGIDKIKLFTTNTFNIYPIHNATYKIQEWFCLDYIYRKREEITRLKEKTK